MPPCLQLIVRTTHSRTTKCQTTVVTTAVAMVVRQRKIWETHLGKRKMLCYVSWRVCCYLDWLFASYRALISGLLDFYRLSVSDYIFYFLVLVRVSHHIPGVQYVAVNQNLSPLARRHGEHTSTALLRLHWKNTNKNLAGFTLTTTVRLSVVQARDGLWTV